MESAITVRRTRGRPGVGVESAVLSSGLPAARRAEVIARVSAVVDAAGAETLFVGVASGRPVVGLEPAELDRLMGPHARKATLAIAHRAGLHVLVTGGIGGAHRGRGGHDVSADLLELARTPAIVVCSGAKAFLDLPATLERPETLGVPVLGYGTTEWPAFWSRTSGLPLTDSAQTPAEVVARWRAWRDLDGRAALVVCVPPPERDALDAETSARLLERALQEVEARDLSAGEVTPYILSRIAEWSDGRSVRANLALLEENARVAARIAVQLEEVTR